MIKNFGDILWKKREYRILKKVVRPQVHTRPHVHQKVEIFGIDIASTMAYRNLRNEETSRIGPLQVNFKNTK